MNEITAQLIGFYAARGAERVREDAAFRELCNAHEGDTGFDATLRKVKNVTTQLERNVDGHSHPEQVEFALRTLNTFRDPDDREIACELVHARYFEFWTDDESTYFDLAAEKLGWQDYFLSFTSYNPTPGEINVVNSSHKYLIRDQTPEAWDDRDERNNANLLANVLDYVLRNRQLRGFYYKRHEGDSDQVMAKLTENAQRSLAFVQLLQSAMFAKPMPNFCRLEYETSAADASKTFVFVRAESRRDFITRDNVDNDLHDWYDDAVVARDAFELAETRRWAAAAIEANLNGIRDHVVENVRAARERLFTEVPR